MRAYRYAVRACRRANGEYEIFNEEDSEGKIVMYRWRRAAQIQNFWTGGCINIGAQNVLQCSYSANNSTFDWVQEPTATGTLRLRNISTGQYLNTQTGKLQCGAVSQSSTGAMWSLGDTVNPGADWLYNYWNGQNQYVNVTVPAIPVVIPTCGMNFDWSSATWFFNEVN